MVLAEKRIVWQNDLIDMSHLNRLLYFTGGARTTTIEFLLDAEHIFKKLLDGRGAFKIDLSATALEPEECAKRLARLRSRAREAWNDRGTHVLYVAFGMLEWREAESSSEVIRSPLVLLPVSLTRAGVLGAFQLARFQDEEITINPTLREKLKRDFQVELPALADVEEQLEAETMPPLDEAALATKARSRAQTQPTLAELLTRIGDAIPLGMPWRIVTEAHLGVFSFQKLVMYQDLQRHDGQVLDHPLLQVLGGEGPLPEDGAGIVAGGALDARVRPHQTVEILDADSSQQEAVVAAKSGASFVLQGPPGTGKSQTIANIIAESLALGRKVLFVSEKMAALEIVRERLAEAGLGDFLLDLHSHKTNKKDFIAELKAALIGAESGPAAADLDAVWQRESDQLHATRGELNTYVRALHAPLLALRRSAFDAYGALARLADVPDLTFSLPGLEGITEADLDTMRQALEQLRTWSDVLDAYETYPWRETLASDYSLALEADIRRSFTRLGAALDRLRTAVIPLRPALAEPEAPLTFGWAELAVRRAETALRTPRPPQHWLTPEAPARLRTLADHAAELSARHARGSAAFDLIYSAAAKQLDHAALRRALTSDATWAISCLRAGEHDPHDVAIQQREELDAHLGRATETLAALRAATRSVAAGCDLPEPQTLDDVAALERMTAALLTSPTPPAAWLDATAFAEVRATALEVGERYGANARTRGALATVYEPAFFALDLPEMARRFADAYASPLRFLLHGYHADLKAVRAMLLPGVAREAAQIRADVAQAASLAREEEWLRARLGEHARLLGHFFDGARTDWQQLDAAIHWTAELHAQLGGGRVPEAIVGLVTGPAQGLRTLRAHHAELAGLLAAWRDEEAFAGATLVAEKLLFGALGFADAEIGTLHAALGKLQRDLRAYWSAVETLTAQQQTAGAGAGGDASTGESGDGSRPWAALCADLALAQELRSIEAWFAENAASLAVDFGPWAAGVATDWAAVFAALDWAATFVGLYPDAQAPALLAHAVSREGDDAGLAHFAGLVEAVKAGFDGVAGELAFATTVLPVAALCAPSAMQAETEIAAMGERVAFHLEHLPCLERWLDCRRQLQRCADLGLGGLIKAALGERPFPPDLVAIFEKRLYQSWLDVAVRQMPALAAFRGATHEQTIARFRGLDMHHFMLARRRLRSLLTHQRRGALLDARAGSDTRLAAAYAQLRREAQKKRHRSIRAIVQSGAPALLRLKPCWMMSPLSVSQYVENGEQLFELVIFDEASQVCPEDAICAILRGKQLIVVGDSQQLPPTRFFAKSLSDEVEDEDILPAEDERTESILDECLAANFSERSLLWHYRSQHEALIAFSNAHFYGGRLHTFPGPQAQHEDGVRFVHVADGVYARSGTRQNQREAERVVDLIFEHLWQHGADRTLGVVALSEAQQRAIEDAIEERLRRFPELRALEEHLDPDVPGGLFIKNLESVQGDERDVIMLSIGYGPDKHGVFYQNLGPLNRKGGERRLNVAVTRARHQLIVVSSIRASDLAGELGGAGARALRDYLDYAENGPAALARQQAQEAFAYGSLGDVESPFEEAVYAALSAKGLALDTQIGCSGYRIDLAVRDPRRPETYLLGIECDGATYHSSATARDRDRLRQQQLERMGWRIHRIWSRDWVRNPPGEIARALLAVEAAQAATPVHEHDAPVDLLPYRYAEPLAVASNPAVEHLQMGDLPPLPASPAITQVLPRASGEE